MIHLNNTELQQKLDKAWGELNKLGIHTEEQLDEANKNLVLDIGILGCRFSEVELQRYRQEYRDSKKIIG